MKIIYFSLTGNIERFIRKVDHKCERGTVDMIVDEKYILITYTINFGEVPKEVEHFINNNNKNLIGVIGSGNRNWGINYCRAAYIIAEQYNVDVLQTFELSGTIHEVEKFNKIVEGLLWVQKVT
ncbi:MAG: class Ib ribonucleoside-diphosphate reductase assembly flavoprotein NrdI [Mycoplasmatales bacterium]